MAGGMLALGVAALLILRGRFDMAALAGGAGAWLLGWSAPPGWWSAFGPRRKQPATVSRVRSAAIEMELDHDTGAISGGVLAGEFESRRLDDLDQAELVRLRAWCLGGDLEGARLVESYLDRRFPGWREHAERDTHRRGRADLQNGPMTEQEAHEILGLKPGAGPEEVRSAHRRLMKTLHPDQGGSTYLASRVNQAKDSLLNRHR
jgi:hypothetical protein